MWDDRLAQEEWYDISPEIIGQENPFLVLHESDGIEPGDVIRFETVCQFILQQSHKELFRDQIHCLWCVYFSRNLLVLLSPLSGSV